MPPETKLNSKGETLYRTPGGNAWTTKDPNRVTAVIKPIAGENAGKTVAILGNSTKQVVQPGQTVSAKGITTSDNAANRAKNANKTLNDITTPTATVENPLTEMYKRLSELQKQLATAKEKEANAEVKGKLESTASAEEVGQGASADMSAGVDAIAGRGTTEGIEDPTIKALADKTTANLAIITNQMQTLDQYRQQFNEYTQQDIDSIARTAERSIKSQIEANQRTTDAMRFAGVLGGRAQFAPVTEQSIIKDVIQEGLDKIEVINEKKNTAIREARKAEAEFNVEAFEQQAELAKEYNNEIESTISAMNAQVRQVEQDERERAKFRQEQADRSAFILAPELMDADEATIYQTALANGIDPGLLAREVQTYKDDQAMNELDMESKRENILSSQQSRILAQARFDREGQKTVDKVKPLTLDEISNATVLYGLGEVDVKGEVLSTLIPNHWTNDDLAQFNSMYGNDMQTAGTIDEKREVLKKFNTVIDAAGQGVEQGLTGEDLNNYVAEQVAKNRKPISEVKQEATNLVKNSYKTFVRKARESGNDALGFSSEKDVTSWIMSPNTQAEIEELAKTMTATQIVKELEKRYGTKKQPK